ncbi:MAG: Tat pathway signal sequence domain protein [Pseudomonadota bacterium]
MKCEPATSPFGVFGRWIGTVSAAIFIALATPALAGDAAPKVKVELNKLEAQGSACQAYLVVENATPEAFTTLSLDLVMFDADGVIAKRLAVEMAPLRAGKTSVKVFGIDGAPCDGISRILVNDVLSCAAGGAARKGCIELIETASRSPADLIN